MVTINDMRSKLMSLDDVKNRISATEPLSQKHVSEESKISFAIEPTWAVGLDTKEGTAPVEAIIRVSGRDHVLTKDALLQAGAAFGLSGKHASVLPSHLLEQELNHWFGPGMGDHEFNMLSTGAEQSVAAFTRPSINPFSNSILMEEVIRGIRDRYGSTEVLADYKFNHSLVRTDIRFIIPEAVRVITGGELADVPSGASDEWAGGIHLTNSLMGKSQTKLETYLFRWWCTNGATSVMDGVGTWSRRGDQEVQDVYEWASQAVDEVLGGLEHNFDSIQALTRLNVDGNVNDVITDILDRFEVPLHQRKSVADFLIETESITMYSIMNAITQTANEPGLNPDRVDKLLRAGGAIPVTLFDSLKSRVWEEGHTADEDAVNPYEIRTTA